VSRFVIFSKYEQEADWDVLPEPAFPEQKIGEEHTKAAAPSNSIFRRAQECTPNHRRRVPAAPFYLSYDAFLFAIRGPLEYRNLGLADGPNLVMSNTVGRNEDRVFRIVRNEIQIHSSLSEEMYHPCPSQPTDCIEITIKIML
jgi:hypothetical protein